jgi:hypothetical protein
MPLPELLKKQLENQNYPNSDITINNAGLDDNDVEALVNLVIDNQTKITSIDLERNNITSKGAELLAQIPWLKHLNLAQNNVTDDGAIALSGNSTMDTLNLSSNALTDIGASAILKFSKCKQINIENNSQVSPHLSILKQPTGLQKFSSLLPKPSSDNNNLSLANTIRIAGHPGLSEFDNVQVTKITPPSK